MALETHSDYLPRHPDFDQHWATHGPMVWRLASLQASILNRTEREKGNRPKFTSRDFVGVATSWFNYCLHRWEPGRGALSTVLFHRFRDHFCRYHLAKESEAWAVYQWNRINQSKRAVIDEAAMSKEYHESEFFLYRVPEEYDQSWAMEVLELFDSPAHFWEYLVHDVPQRAADIVLWCYRDGRTYEDIGRSLPKPITKERVRQIIEATKLNFRARIEKLEAFRRLFAEDAESESE